MSATAEAFYRDVVGADFIARFDPPGLLFFDLDGTRVLFEAGGAAKGNSILYLWTDDLDACVAELEAKGVRFTHPPQAVHTDADGTFGAAGETEWMAFFEDPEGNTVALVTRKCASAAWSPPPGRSCSRCVERSDCSAYRIGLSVVVRSVDEYDKPDHIMRTSRRSPRRPLYMEDTKRRVGRRV